MLEKVLDKCRIIRRCNYITEPAIRLGFILFLVKLILRRDEKSVEALTVIMHPMDAFVKSGLDFSVCRCTAYN